MVVDVGDPHPLRELRETVDETLELRRVRPHVADYELLHASLHAVEFVEELIVITQPKVAAGGRPCKGGGREAIDVLHVRNAERSRQLGVVRTRGPREGLQKQRVAGCGTE